jgi:hypothetical protein
MSLSRALYTSRPRRSHGCGHSRFWCSNYADVFLWVRVSINAALCPKLIILVSILSQIPPLHKPIVMLQCVVQSSAASRAYLLVNMSISPPPRPKHIISTPSFFQSSVSQRRHVDGVKSFRAILVLQGTTSPSSRMVLLSKNPSQRPHVSPMRAF